MSGISDKLLYPTLSGLIVAVLAYILLGESTDTASIKTTYSYIEYNDDFVEALVSQIDDFEKSKEAQLLTFDLETPNDLGKVLDALKSYLVLDGRLGPLGIIEQTNIKNLESERSATIKIEGRETAITVVDSARGENLVLLGEFSESIDLLPGGNARILSLVPWASKSRFDDHRSRNIYVSVDGRYFEPDDLSLLTDEPLISWITQYPFVVFLLMVSGILALPLVAIAIALTPFSRVQYQVIKWLTSADDLAKYHRMTQEILEEDTEKSKKLRKLIS